MQRTKKPTPPSLSVQMKKKVTKANNTKKIETPKYDGVFKGNNISTGSTLLDLAISGGRVYGGGLPGGILVEIFGPNGSGKTVLLSEIGGDIQRKGGELKFNDPEARLNPLFAKIFGLELEEGDYSQPDTVPEVFKSIRAWKPPVKEGLVHGFMADSLAALSTDMEMDNEDGDKMGMRRAKEFSEELRKTCRLLVKNNILMVCSNQIRENINAQAFSQKYKTPGGESVGFYASVRLKTSIIKKIKSEKTIKGKKVSRIVGVELEVEVFKNSIWKPYRTAPVTIIFDYGIDDIRQNLQFIKNYTGRTVYAITDKMLLSKGMEESISKVEEEGLEDLLRNETILLWNKIEREFDSNRKPRR